VIDAVLALVPAYGAAALFAVAAMSCFGLPVPGSIALLAAGAFVAAGEMPLSVAATAALAGAVAGDQAGYWLGFAAGPQVIARLSRWPSIRTGLEAARAFSERRGRSAVFLSRWLVSPLGPPVNFLSGTVGMAWPAFSLAGALGEVVWVSGYLALGAAFGRSIVGIAEVLDDLTWFLAAGLVAVLLFLRLLGQARAVRRTA
jgi:membrane protein DedA with SNARE-associated domain